MSTHSIDRLDASTPTTSPRQHQPQHQSESSTTQLLPKSSLVPSNSPRSSSSESPSSSAKGQIVPRGKQRRNKATRRAQHRRRGHYQVNPAATAAGSPPRPSPNSSLALPLEPSTNSDSFSSSSSSSSSSSPSHASFDLSEPPVPGSNVNVINSQQVPVVSRTRLQLELQLANQPQRHNQPRNSLTFWDLITDVAKDLDLELQDLSPDVEIFEEEGDKEKDTTSSSNVVARSRRLANPKRVSGQVVNSFGNAQSAPAAVSYQADPNSDQPTSDDAPSPVPNSGRPGLIATQSNLLHQHHPNSQQSVKASSRNPCKYYSQSESLPPSTPPQTHRAFHPEDHRQYRISEPESRLRDLSDNGRSHSQLQQQQKQQQQQKSQSQLQSHSRFTSARNQLQSGVNRHSSTVSHKSPDAQPRSQPRFNNNNRRKQPESFPIASGPCLLFERGTHQNQSTANRLLLKSSTTTTTSDSRPLIRSRRIRDPVVRKPSKALDKLDLLSQSSKSSTNAINYSGTSSPRGLSPANKSSKPVPNLGRRRLTGNSRGGSTSVSVGSNGSILVTPKISARKPTVVGSLLKSEYRPSRLSSKVSPATDSLSKNSRLGLLGGKGAFGTGGRLGVSHSSSSSLVQPLCPKVSKSVRIVAGPRQSLTQPSAFQPVSDDKRIKIPRASLPPQHPSSQPTHKSSHRESSQVQKGSNSSPPSRSKPATSEEFPVLPEGNVDEEVDVEEEEMVVVDGHKNRLLSGDRDESGDDENIDHTIPVTEVTDSMTGSFEPVLVVDRTCRRININEDSVSSSSSSSSLPLSASPSAMSQSDHHLLSQLDPEAKQDQPDLEERLRLTHQIWLLPEVNRATVVHYLQGRSVGVFIVRQSSKPNTMALSVRLPQGRGPHVEHYLIEKRNTSKSSGLFRLEGSDHYFNTMQSLVLHYAHCCDELPVKLTLAPVLLSCSASQLVSLALLDQQFWQSKFVSLKQLPKNSLNTEALAEEVTGSKSKSKTHADCKAKQESKLKRATPSSLSSDSFSSNLSLTSVSSHHSGLSSISPVPQPRRSLQRRSHNNSSKSHISPPIPNCSITRVSSSPPPIPPKLPVEPGLSLKVDTSPLVDCRKSSVVQEKPAASPPVINTETPKLPPRTVEPPPPPLPPRTPRCNDLDQQKSSKDQVTPAKPSVDSSFSISELLSPMSMTESEIEIVKLANRAQCPLPLPTGASPPSIIRRSPNANYYNHHHHQQPPKLPPANNSQSQKTKLSQLPEPKKSPQLPQIAPVLSKGTLLEQNSCDVYTQTAVNPTVSKHHLVAGPSKARASSALSMSSSSYYMDPVDAIVDIQFSRRGDHPGGSSHKDTLSRHSSKRHSDPELGSQHSAVWDTLARHNSLQSLLENFRKRFPNATATATTTTVPTATSISEMDPLVEPLKPSRISSPQPSLSSCLDPLRSLSRTGPAGSTKPADAGFSTVDSTWQWLGVNQQSGSNGLGSNTVNSDNTTVEDRIGLRAPELAVPRVTHLNDGQLTGVSSYDNLGKSNHHHHQHTNNRVCAGPTPNNNNNNNQNAAAESRVELSSNHLDNFKIESKFQVQDQTRPLSQRFESGGGGVGGTNLSHQLLKTDLINFNSFLLLGDQGSSIGANQDEDSDDYDNVPMEDYGDEDEEEIYGEYDIRLQKPGQKGTIEMEREDSLATLKDHNQNYYRNNNNHKKGFSQALVKDLTGKTLGDSVMLNIVHNLSEYVFELAVRKDNTFGMSIDNFIQCTKDSAESNPTVILGYIRQFMNGMKNYLIKHGEGQFLEMVQLERERLKSNQFLNIDSILECALQKLVIRPLKSHIYDLFIKALQSSGSLKLLSHNIKRAQANPPAAAQRFGVRPELLPLDPSTMAQIQDNLRQLQQSYSPIKKLEQLLRCVAIISGGDNSSGISLDHSRPSKLNGDDLLPMLVYLIVQCGLISAEVEIEYMLGLLHPSILNGEGSYYLTVFSSAVQILKNMYPMNHDPPPNRQTQPSLHQSALAIFRDLKNSTQASSPNPGDITFAMASAEPCSPVANSQLQSHITILFPNELSSSITCKTVPVRPSQTAREVCRMLAHRFRITNPEDYGLFSVVAQNVQREDVQLLDSDCPQLIKAERIARKEPMGTNGTEPLFAYKRCDAKFIWPANVVCDS